MPYLTKSRFQTGMECPTKLYYQSNAEKYTNTKTEDQFLEALALGGFQVGALARAYHPEGVLIAEESNEGAVNKTNELLAQENCTLFEAAILAGDFLVKIDILVKKGDNIQLIEVKAKSFNSDEDSFSTNKGQIRSAWKPYLTDVAFQVMVLQTAFPQFHVSAYLMLADKTKKATVDGLNQQFKISKTEGRVTIVQKHALTPDDLGDRVLIKVPVSAEVEILLNEAFELGGTVYTLSSYAESLATDLKSGKKRFTSIGKHCLQCEFQTDGDHLSSGFIECWSGQTGLSAEQLMQPLLFELWRGSLGSKDILTPLFNRKIIF
ncbi:hypothetical protein ACFQZS_03415 [Mucilaginibacter calamicampi]|uniref:PD-(D/E)XK nuclease superfamily protein n=1 Tax=Mucilaginibacter calamicampi TaxID=1302352 RepID=A0ABW2YT77_9SPHI